MTTITPYDHTAVRFANGSNIAGDTYFIKLYSALTPNTANTTLAQVDAGGTELSTANGYTAGGQNLANVAISQVTTNDAKFDADDVVWTATGTLTAAYAVIFNGTDASDPPVAYIDFEGNVSATDDTFTIAWNANGIITFTVT